jgi:hypothetical protein
MIRKIDGKFEVTFQMPEPTALNFEKHGKLRLSNCKDFTQHKSQYLVPVVRNSNSGDFVPAALMGLRKGVNLFCQTPEWPATFIPSTFMLPPFSALRVQADTDEAVIAIDEESDLLSTSVGELMFDADGKYTPYLQKRIDQVIEVTRHSLQSLNLINYIAKMNLLKTGTLTLQFNASAKYELEGVYTIDEEAVQKLNDEEYLELRKRGLLPMIYSHLTSLHQLTRIIRLQQKLDQDEDSAAPGNA